MPTTIVYGYSADILQYNPSTGAFEFDASYNFTTDRIKITFNDDDSSFDGDDEELYNGSGTYADDEIGSDTNQTAVIETPDGNLIASGLVYDEAYAEIALPGGGFAWLERVEINGQHVGYISSVQLTPGESYSVSYSDEVYAPNTLTYDQLNSIPCFAPDTPIKTDKGDAAAARLRVGDQVLTKDGGFQPVRAVLRRRVQRSEGEGNLLFSLPANALGIGLPRRRVKLSANHAVLVSGAMCELLFGACEMLVEVKHLARAGLCQDVTPDGYFDLVHVLLEGHHILSSAGLWSESFYLSKDNLGHFGLRQRLAIAKEVTVLGDLVWKMARPRLRAFEARVLCGHLKQNGRQFEMRKKRIA